MRRWNDENRYFTRERERVVLWQTPTRHTKSDLLCGARNRDSFYTTDFAGQENKVCAFQGPNVHVVLRDACPCENLGNYRSDRNRVRKLKIKLHFLTVGGRPVRLL